ncbi:E3 ubiquitin-protein ligase synoviolin [Nematocida sp. AWRm78]|nr:E3 ubiquitin-protein ligase synoviolin [Nematocida sp. AWRm78]
MNMYRHEAYLAVYITALAGICAADFINGKNLYGSLVGMVESRVYHFLLSLFFIGSLYVFGRALVSFSLGSLSALEKEGVNENGIRYLGNTCLVITLFADNITIKTVVLFAFVFGLKSLHWLVGFRIEALEKSGTTYDRIERIVGLVGLLFLVDGILAYRFVSLMFSLPGVSILFAFEFFTLFAYSIRSLYSLSILHYISSSIIEDRVFLLFYGDFGFCLVKILANIICLIITTMYFRMPINLLREVVIAIKHLVSKTRSMMAYKTLITLLEQCPDVKGDELGADKICLICHEEMNIGKKLDCGHVLHMGCLKEWLHRQQACPVCRKEVLVKPEAEPASSGSTEESGQNTPAEPNSNVSSIVRVLLNGHSDEYEGVPVTLNNQQP